MIYGPRKVAMSNFFFPFRFAPLGYYAEYGRLEWLLLLFSISLNGCGTAPLQSSTSVGSCGRLRNGPFLICCSRAALLAEANYSHFFCCICPETISLTRYTFFLDVVVVGGNSIQSAEILNKIIELGRRSIRHGTIHRNICL